MRLVQLLDRIAAQWITRRLPPPGDPTNPHARMIPPTVPIIASRTLPGECGSVEEHNDSAQARGPTTRLFRFVISRDIAAHATTFPTVSVT